MSDERRAMEGLSDLVLNRGRGPEICLFYEKRVMLIQHTQELLRMRKQLLKEVAHGC